MNGCVSVKLSLNTIAAKHVTSRTDTVLLDTTYSHIFCKSVQVFSSVLEFGS